VGRKPEELGCEDQILLPAVAQPVATMSSALASSLAVSLLKTLRQELTARLGSGMIALSFHTAEQNQAWKET